MRGYRLESDRPAPGAILRTEIAPSDRAHSIRCKNEDRLVGPKARQDGLGRATAKRRRFVATNRLLALVAPHYFLVKL
jgi:hypothetical protein